MSTINSINIAGKSKLVSVDISKIPNHHRYYVETVKDYFRYEKASVATADGYVVVQPNVGTGRWIRENIPATDWSLQQNWYIDPTNGSDEFDGYSSSISGVTGPIRTFAELVRRLGKIFRVLTATTVNLLGSTSEYVDLAIDPLAGNTFILQGLLTQQFQGNLSAVTNINSATNTPADATAAWNPTTELNRLALNTQTGAYSWVAKDLTGGKARLANWALISLTAGNTIASSNSSVGNQVTTYTLPQIAGFTLTVYGAAFGGAHPAPVLINNIEVTGVSGRPRITSLGAQVGFQNCKLSTNSPRIAGGRIEFFNCCFTNPNTFVGQDSGTYILIGGGLLTGVGPYTVGSLSRLVTQTNVLVQDSNIIISQESYLNATSGGICFMDSSTDALTVIEKSSVVLAVSSNIWGTNNTGHGVVLEAGSVMVYDSATIPTINVGLGTGREILVGMTEKLWSELPYVEEMSNTSAVVR